MNKIFTTSLQRLLFYIVVNILVSACVTLSILWFWDRNKETPDVTSANQALATLIPHVDGTDVPTQTPIPLPPTSEEYIRIENVIGAGNLADEVVLLKRVGEGELNLSGWKLKPPSGNAYTFPMVILYQEGAIQVHTTSGADSIVDLYWGRDSAAWKSGDTVVLLDSEGNQRATYEIP